MKSTLNDNRIPHQTESLSLGDLALLTALSSTVFIVCEGKKLIERYSMREIRQFLSGQCCQMVQSKERKGSNIAV